MPRQVQKGEEAVALSKHYNLKGKLPLQLDETIVPVHIVGQLRPGDLRAAHSQFKSAAAAGVGNNSMVGVFNPPDSGVLVYPRGFRFRLGVTSLIVIQVDETAVSGTFAISNQESGTRWDKRAKGVSTARVFNSAFSGQAGQYIDSYNVVAGAHEPFEPVDGVVLPPGWTIFAQRMDSSNSSVQGTWIWEEAAILPSD